VAEAVKLGRFVGVGVFDGSAVWVGALEGVAVLVGALEGEGVREGEGVMGMHTPAMQVSLRMLQHDFTPQNWVLHGQQNCCRA